MPVTVELLVGQPVTFHYVGVCAEDGRLAVSDPRDNRSFRSIDGHAWAPTARGRRIIEAVWSCSGPVRCPLEFLGTITVTTP